MKFSAALVATVAAATVSAAPTPKSSSKSAGTGTAVGVAVGAAAAGAAAGAAAAAKGGASFNGKTVTTWWGQSTHELTEVCDNANFDVVMLSFITSLNTPALNLAKDTGAPSAAQKAKGWNKMFDGTVTPPGGKSVADQIKYCKGKGKKVMVSFGGDATMSDSTFKSAAAAQQGADYVWNLYLGGTSMPTLRPFGKDVVLDGLDLDNEHMDGSYYKEFIDALKAKMGGDRGKYLLSAAPMCSQVSNDGSTSPIPSSVLGELDFVNVQFYNNPNQGINAPGFKANAQQWADKLHKANPKTKLMIGMPGAQKAATGDHTSVLSADAIKTALQQVKSWNLPGLGGAAIWDAGYTMDNGNFAASVKAAL